MIWKTRAAAFPAGGVSGMAMVVGAHAWGPRFTLRRVNTKEGWDHPGTMEMSPGAECPKVEARTQKRRRTRTAAIRSQVSQLLASAAV